jgi:membrane protein involved in colicin uptake
MPSLFCKTDRPPAPSLSHFKWSYLDKDAAKVEVQRAGAEEKARGSGQPLHVKAAREAESKAKAAAEAVASAHAELDGIVQRLFPGGAGSPP